MTDIGELVVRIRADAAQLEREMQRANGVIRQGAGEMGGAFGRLKSELLSLAPAVSAVGLVAFGKRAVDAAGHIVDLADRIGFASDTLAALEAPLAASGSNLDEFAAAINRMNNILGEAAKGNEEAVKAFDQLGLSVTRLRSLSPEQQFYEIASALGRIKDQSTQTEAGMNLFGRGFATLLPLLKQYGGDMRKAVDAQKDLNDGLSQETLDRIDRFGDALAEAGIKARNAFLEAFGALLKVIETVPEVEKLADETASRYDLGKGSPTTGNTKFGQTGGAVIRSSGPHTQYPLEEADHGAKGDNKGLLGMKEVAQAAKDRAKQIQDARDALDDYNRSLREEATTLGLSDREAAGQEARFKVEEIARKGNIALTKEQIDATAELAERNYDLKESQDEVNKATQEAARFQQELHDKLSSSLTDIAFKAGSAKQAMLDFATSIARAAFEKRVAGPIADALVGTGGKSGLFDDAIGGVGKLLGFAEGGDPPVGVPSIVGEDGPEIFVPKTAGTVVPNGKFGGTTVIVQQTINMSPGLEETVGAAVRQAAPSIALQAKQMVLAGARMGGAESQIFNLRN